MSRSDTKWEASPAVIFRSAIPIYDKENDEVLGLDTSRLLSRCESLDSDAVPQRALIINDGNGLIYEAAIGHSDDGQPQLTSLTINATVKGQHINHDVLRAVPTRLIAQHVARHFANEDDAGQPLFADGPNDDDQRPTPEEFASAYSNGIGRDELAKRYGVSKDTISAWTRKGRDAGLIPATKMGRPRSKTAQPKKKSDKEMTISTEGKMK